MTDNPLLVALVESAQSGDTYSAWMSFRAFLTRRLRSPAIAANALATYAMLVTAMESAAAATLDTTMATDLCDAFLETYRREGQHSLRSDVMGALLQQLRDAFRNAVHVEERTATRSSAGGDADVSGAVAEIGLGQSVVPAIFGSPTSNTAFDGVHLKEKMAAWLEARAVFAEKVLGALLAELRGGGGAGSPLALSEAQKAASASSEEECATVRDWRSVCAREATDETFQLFMVWLQEIATARLQALLVREILYRDARQHSAAASSPSSSAEAPENAANREETRWQDLLRAADNAMDWSVHTFCGTPSQADATIGCLLRYLLNDFGGVRAPHLPPPASSRNVREMQLELVSSFFHQHVFGHVLSESHPVDPFLDDDVVSVRDGDQLWKVFPLPDSQLRRVCLPVCTKTLQAWLSQQPQQHREEHNVNRVSEEGTTSMTNLVVYTRFLVALMCLVQHTPTQPRAANVQQSYEKVVTLLVQRFHATLERTPTLQWEELAKSL